jgi:hypothetical protein
MTTHVRRDQHATVTAPVAPPGTWLADVDRDVTVHLLNLISLSVAGLDVVKNRILIGVNAAGDQPGRIEDRVDYVGDTAQEALCDIAVVRDLVGLASATIAYAAVETGSDYEQVCEWAGAQDDPRILRAVNDRLLNGVESDLTELVGALAAKIQRSPG